MTDKSQLKYEYLLLLAAHP